AAPASPRTIASAAHPAVTGELLLGAEALLVVHLRRALDPVAEIEIRHAEAVRVGDVLEDHVGAEPTPGGLRVVDAVLHHHGVVEHAHVGHAAVGVTRIDVGAKQRILLRGRCRLHAAGNEVLVDLDHAAQRPARAELADQHAHRHAGLAALAVG